MTFQGISDVICAVHEYDDYLKECICGRCGRGVTELTFRIPKEEHLSPLTPDDSDIITVTCPHCGTFGAKRYRITAESNWAIYQAVGGKSDNEYRI